MKNRKLDRAAEAAQRDEIKALLHAKNESTKRYEESLRKYSSSSGDTVVKCIRPHISLSITHNDSDDDDIGDLKMSTLAIPATITTKSLETCMQHIRGLLKDIDALQKSLSSNNTNPSEHQQSLIGSYFRARGHLDAVLLGNPRSSEDIQGIKVDKIERKRPVEETAAKLEILKGQDAEIAQLKAELRALKVKDRMRTRELEIQAKRREMEKTATSKAADDSAERRAVEEKRRRIEEEMRAQKIAEEHAKQAAEEAAMRVAAEEAARAAKKAFEEAKAAAEKEAKAAKEAYLTKQKPILFKDAIGRKFNFPFHLCSTWQVSTFYSHHFSMVDLSCT